MFARTPALPPCSCPLRLSPSGKTVDPEAPLPASPVCDRDSTRRFHGAHSRLIRLLHSSLRPHALLPQDKQVGNAAGDPPQPVHRRTLPAPEPRVLPLRPFPESLIEVTEHLNAPRAIEPPVVVQPAPHHRVHKASQILQALVVPGGRHPPVADGLPDRRRGLGADRRQEAHEVSPPPVLRPSRLEGVAEEVERDVFILPRPVAVLAVDDPGLRGMKLQTALRETTPDRLQHRLCFRLAPAMDECIVRVALEPEVRVDPRHPAIERVVQEEVGQKLTPPCGVPFVRSSRVPSGCSTGARSHRPTYSFTQARSVWWATARSIRSRGMDSKKALMSRSMTQSVLQQRFRAVPTASSADRPGR